LVDEVLVAKVLQRLPEMPGSLQTVLQEWCKCSEFPMVNKVFLEGLQALYTVQQMPGILQTRQ